MEEKKLDTLVWKGNKSLGEDGKYHQTEKRLVDMVPSELGTAYDHCKTMLFNKDNKNPGRYLLLEVIQDQKDRCGAELFLRYLETEKELKRFSVTTLLSDFLINNKEGLKGTKPILSHAFSGLPSEYEALPINYVLDGCLDRLGAFNRKHITRTFILRQGIWLTPTEIKELMIVGPSGKPIDRISIIRSALGIKDIEYLDVNATGLNYTQMRAMLNLKPNKKYGDLTTMQLETLRYRILFSLEETVRFHIEEWEKRMGDIEEVAKHLGFKL